MTLAERQRLEERARQPDPESQEPERRGWYDPDAASYVELVERVVAIQRRRTPARTANRVPERVLDRT